MGSFLDIYSNGLVLNEAFQAKDMQKAVKLIKKYLERKTSMKFYEVDVEKFKNKFGTQVGIRYFIGNGLQSVRFNWLKGQKSSEISSIDIWDNSDNKFPTIHIDVADISVARILPQLTQFIKNPKIGSLAYESIEITNEFLLGEAKVTVGSVTYRSAKDAIIALAQQGKTFDEIMKLTGANPGAINYHMKKAVNAVAGATDEVRVAGSDEKRADKLQQNAMKFADPEKELPNLKILINNVITGINPSLVISGGAGSGKTHTVKTMLAAKGLQRGDGYKLVKGTATANGLYTTLFLNKDKIIVFDDTDSIWGDKIAVNILKAALDSSDERIVSWNSKNTYDPELTGLFDYEAQREYYGETGKLPAEFEFTGGIIFITNLHIDQLDMAVKNRSAVIDVTFSPDDIAKIVRGIIPDFDVTTRGKTIKPSKKDQEIVYKAFEEYIKANPDKYSSVRTFINFLKAYVSGAPNWKELATKYFY